MNIAVRTGGDFMSRIQLYVQSGCSSCLRAKEFLGKTVDDFDVFDIANDPAAFDRLEARGISTVPVVLVDDEYCFAQDVAVLAEFLGVAATAHSLTPETLLERYDRALSLAIDLIRQVPDDLFIERAIATRDRSVGLLGHHVLNVADRMVAGLDTGHWVKSTPILPGDMNNADDVARYGDETRAKLRMFAARAEDFAFRSPIRTYYGNPSAHYLLERSVWHSVHHMRQLREVLEQHGIVPAAAIDAALTSGLPMPDGVWD